MLASHSPSPPMFPQHSIRTAHAIRSLIGMQLTVLVLTIWECFCSSLSTQTPQTAQYSL